MNPILRNRAISDRRDSSYLRMTGWQPICLSDGFSRAIEVAADPVIRRDVNNSWHHLPACCHHFWTARRKRTTRGRVNESWRFRTRLDFLLHRSMWIRDRRKEKLGVGMGG